MTKIIKISNSKETLYKFILFIISIFTKNELYYLHNELSIYKNSKKREN